MTSSVLRRWPNAAALTDSNNERSILGVRSALGVSRTTAESTFGGGVNARAGIRIEAGSPAHQLLITDKRPKLLFPGGSNSICDLRLKHQYHFVDTRAHTQPLISNGVATL